jgi:hypothetical protein
VVKAGNIGALHCAPLQRLATPRDASLTNRPPVTIKPALTPTQAFVLKVGNHQSNAP